MFDRTERKRIAYGLIPLAMEAGEIILKARAEGAQVKSKADNSPVTAADERCEDYLLRELHKLFPHIPTVSEESGIAETLKEGADTFFLIDPLDGTKEFIAGNDEFTVNIALVEKGIATMGLLHVPAQNRLFLSWGKGEAFMKKNDSTEFIPLVPQSPQEPTILTSRAHLDPQTSAFLKKVGPHKAVGLGSAFKFALLANGEAQLYPRFAPTMLWDTAAGQAIVEAIGGVVWTLEGKPLRYDPHVTLKNPDFLAASSLQMARWALQKLALAKSVA